MVRVSVIIPNYNHEKYLKQRIESVLNQSFEDFEVIILDDNSSDRSRWIIEEYRNNPKISSIYYNKLNSGSPFIQWQKGISFSKGEYIWIAESDDYADSQFLEKVLEKIESNPSIALCYTNSNIVKSDEIISKEIPSRYYNNLFNTNRWDNNFTNDGINELNNYLGNFCTIINASSCVFKKEAFIGAKPEIDSFKYCGDWLTWIELCKQGGSIAYIETPLNYFRIHPNSTLNQYDVKVKAKELYRCLVAKKQNKSEIYHTQCLDVFWEIWTCNSLRFYINNLDYDLLILQLKIDKKYFIRKSINLFLKNLIRKVSL